MGFDSVVLPTLQCTSAVHLGCSTPDAVVAITLVISEGVLIDLTMCCKTEANTDAQAGAQLGLARTPGSASFLAPEERAALQHRQDAEKRRSRMASPAQGRWYGAPCPG